MARRLNIIPISIANNTLTVIMADPSDVFALEAISATTKMRVKPIGGRVDEVRKLLTSITKVMVKLKTDR